MQKSNLYEKDVVQTKKKLSLQSWQITWMGIDPVGNWSAGNWARLVSVSIPMYK